MTISAPLNGLPLPGNGGRVKIEGEYAGTFLPIPTLPDMAKRFLNAMGKGSWQPLFNESDNALCTDNGLGRLQEHQLCGQY